MDPQAVGHQAVRDLAHKLVVATAEGTSDSSYEAVQSFLHEVRTALGMDVAFVSHFEGDRRTFRVVSADGGAPAELAAGASDPLLDTYCQRVISGTLPLAIPDVRDQAEANALPITQRLRIRAYLSAPVVLRNGQVYGTVCCFSHGVRPHLGPSDISVLRAVADAIAMSVDRFGAIRAPIWRMGRK